MAGLLCDEKESFVVDEENLDTDQIRYDDNQAELFVDEGECNLEDDMLVVEEDGCMNVPGSDAKLENAADDEPKEITWKDDKDHSKFVAYIIHKKNNIPRHSGSTLPGCQRARAYLKSLDNEISQAMRTDLDGVIDEQQIDSVRKEIDQMIDRLDLQIKKIQGSKKADVNVRLFSDGECIKCGSKAPTWHDIENDQMVCMACGSSENEDAGDDIKKEAGAASLNIYISAFERAITGILINSHVSAGRNIEDVYNHLKDKYSFTAREELAIHQILADSGFPVLKDRGRIGEDCHPASGDGIDFQTNYSA